MMRMIDWFTRPRRQRESTGDQLAIGGVDRVKHGLFERIGIEKCGKRGAAGSDGDRAMCRVGDLWRWRGAARAWAVQAIKLLGGRLR